MLSLMRLGDNIKMPSVCGCLPVSHACSGDGTKTVDGLERLLFVFDDVCLFSFILMQTSRRNHFNNMAEHVRNTPVLVTHSKPKYRAP